MDRRERERERVLGVLIALRGETAERVADAVLEALGLAGQPVPRLSDFHEVTLGGASSVLTLEPERRAGPLGSWQGMVRLGRQLAVDHLCDLNMPHDTSKRAPIGCPPNCPAPAHVPTVNGVTPFVDLEGKVHSPLCGSVIRSRELEQPVCTCYGVVSAGEGVPFDPTAPAILES